MQNTRKFINRCRSPVIAALLFSLILTGSAHAYTGQGVADGIKNGTVWVTGGIYSVLKFIVVEVFRPVKAVTHGITRLVGVTVEE